MMRVSLPAATATGSSRSIRRGALLAEMTIAAAMLAVVMVLTVKVLGFAGQQRRSAEQRQRAMLEVANLMERITAEPFEEVTPERAHRLSIAPETARSLPGAEVAVEVTEERPGPNRSGKRIAVRLRWKGRSGEWEAPARLTTWIERGRSSR